MFFFTSLPAFRTKLRSSWQCSIIGIKSLDTVFHLQTCLNTSRFCGSSRLRNLSKSFKLSAWEKKKEINLTKLKFFIKKNNIYQIILIKLKFQLQFFAFTLEKINTAKNLYRDQRGRQFGSQQNPSFSRQPNGNESTVKYGKNRGFIFLNQPFPSEIEQRKNTKIREWFT